MTIEASADVGATLLNEGDLNIATNAGRVDMDDFIQTASGRVTFGLGGSLLNAFDRMVVSGSAQLDGNTRGLPRIWIHA